MAALPDQPPAPDNPLPASPEGTEPNPPLAFPEIIALYERDVDRTLIRENLRLTPDERARQLMERIAG